MKAQQHISIILVYIAIVLVGAGAFYKQQQLTDNLHNQITQTQVTVAAVLCAAADSEIQRAHSREEQLSIIQARSKGLSLLHQTSCPILEGGGKN